MAFILASGIEWKDIRAVKPKPAAAKVDELDESVVTEKTDTAPASVVKKEEV